MSSTWRRPAFIAFLTLGVATLAVVLTATFRGSATAQAEFTCTQIIGYSTTSSWFPAAEALLENRRWQLLYNDGGAVGRWADPNYPGWRNPPISPCAQDSLAPDRIVLDVAVNAYTTNVALVEREIRQAIATIRRKYPSVRQIVLQPEHGGPDHATCPWSEVPFGVVRATYNHSTLEAAIDRVVSGDIVRGADPLVSMCSDFADPIGHVTSGGARSLGTGVGRFYAISSPKPVEIAPTVPLAEVTPTPPPATVVPAAADERGSLRLDGIGAWANAPDEAEINSVGDWTVEVWFKDEHPDGYAHERARIITKGDTASAEVPFFVDIWMGQLWAGRRVGGATQVISFDLAADDVTPDAWHHVVATFDSALFRLTLYLDGAPVAQGTFNGYSLGTTLPLSIGRNGGSEPNFWLGKLDEVRLWNLVRTAAEIQAHPRERAHRGPARARWLLAIQRGGWHDRPRRGRPASGCGAPGERRMVGGVTDPDPCKLRLSDPRGLGTGAPVISRVATVT